ncbi:MAG: thiamine phosphate synthase [Verrucomicrobiota bacterium]
MNPLLSSSQLYGILDTGYVAPADIGAMAQKLLRGGIRILQLRAKKSSEAEVLAMAQQILPIVRAAEGIFILNDHPHLVPIVGADGAHIGQDDMTVAEARRLAGEKAIIGLSTHSLEQVEQAVLQQPDYIGFGPLFATPTKPDYKAIGLADIPKAQAMVPFPIFCIGGITEKTLPQVVAAGVQRIVVVSDLLKAEDPCAKARKFLGIVQK